MGDLAKKQAVWSLLIRIAVVFVIVAVFDGLVGYLFSQIPRLFTEFTGTGYEITSMGRALRTLSVVFMILVFLAGSGTAAFFVYKFFKDKKSEDIIINEQVDTVAPTIPHIAYDDEEMQQVLGGSVKHEAQQYFDSFSWAKLKSEFKTYTEANGFPLSEKQVVETLSALCASKMLVFIGNSEYNLRFSTLICGFFGYGARIQKLTDRCKSFDDLLYNHNRGKETDFADQLYSAVYRKRNINIVALGNVETEKSDAYFMDIFEYMKAPKIQKTIVLNKFGKFSGYQYVENGKIILPENLWFAIIPKDGSDLKMPYHNEIYSSYIASTQVYTPTDNGAYMYGDSFNEAYPDYGINIKEGALLSYDTFTKLFDDAYAKYSLTLETWKKIDKFEAILKDMVGFSIDNIMARQMEAYVSAYLALTGNEMRALDSVLARKVLPALKKYPKETLVKEEKNLWEIMIELFGEDNLSSSFEMINLLQLI